MSQSQLNFTVNPAEYEIWGAGGDFLPEEGKYPVIIVDTAYEPTKANPNNYKLSLILEVIGGKFKGKRFGQSLNIAHSTDTTREAAMKQLASYCTAMGISQAWSDATILHNKPFQVWVTADKKPSEKNPNTTYTTNDVTKYFYANGDPIQQGIFASGAQLSVVFNEAPTIPAPQATIAPPAQQQTAPPVQQAQPPQTGYGAAPQNQAPPQNQAAPNGAYGNAPPAHNQGQPNFNQGNGQPNFAPQGQPNFNQGGQPNFNQGNAPTGAPTGQFGAPPANFNR